MEKRIINTTWSSEISRMRVILIVTLREFNYALKSQLQIPICVYVSSYCGLEEWHYDYFSSVFFFSYRKKKIHYFEKKQCTWIWESKITSSLSPNIRNQDQLVKPKQSTITMKIPYDIIHSTYHYLYKI